MLATDTENSAFENWTGLDSETLLQSSASVTNSSPCSIQARTPTPYAPEIRYHSPYTLKRTVSMVRRPVTRFEVEELPLSNVVSAFELGGKVNLKKIAMAARNVEYNPRRFSACIMRIRNPNATAMIFGSGKVVVTGSKSETTAKLAARRVGRNVQKILGDTSFFNFRICNMVGHVDVKFPIHLEEMLNQLTQEARDNQRPCEVDYHSDIFPGMFFRMIRPKVVVLIFASGKVIITGAKRRTEIQEAFNNIYPLLKRFQFKKCY